MVSLHGGNIERAAREYQLQENKIIDFSASINPLGPSPRVYEALVEQLWKVKHYPDPDCGELPQLLSNHLEISKENILLGNGGAELIYLLPRFLQTKKALVVGPTFSEYAMAVEAAGGTVKHITLPLQQPFSILEEIKKQALVCDTVFLCNPNNPTGFLYRPEELLSLLEVAEQYGITMVLDEAFIDFVDQRQEYTLMPEACARKNLVVLYSLTKFFGIPGLRLGAAVANSETIQRLRRLKDPWSVNTLARVAGEAALRDQMHMVKTIEMVKKERDYLFSALRHLPGFDPLPSRANFLLVNVSNTGIRSAELTDKLARLGLLIRDCANFYGLNDEYIRLAVRNRTENEILLSTFRKIAVNHNE